MNVISRDDAIAAGLKTYFTGEPCKHGHVSARHTAKNNQCVECRKIGQKKHYAANSVTIKERVAAYKQANPEKAKCWAKARWDSLTPEEKRQELERLSEWGRINSDRRKEAERSAAKIRRQNNPEYVSRKKAASHIRNRDKNYARNLKWKRANPDKVRASCSKRRARALGAEGSHTAADICDIFELQKKCCAYCKKSLLRVGSRGRHVDHILPLAKGGHNGRSNLQILCQRCNNRKHAKGPEQFARELGMLL